MGPGGLSTPLDVRGKGPNAHSHSARAIQVFASSRREAKEVKLRQIQYKKERSRAKMATDVVIIYFLNVIMGLKEMTTRHLCHGLDRAMCSRPFLKCLYAL